jgi:hypothetical protein
MITADYAPDLADRCSEATACAEAADRLYEAEVALHAARETGIDAWIASAYDNLHRAVSAHRAAEARCRCGGRQPRPAA